MKDYRLEIKPTGGFAIREHDLTSDTERLVSSLPYLESTLQEAAKSLGVSLFIPLCTGIKLDGPSR